MMRPSTRVRASNVLSADVRKWHTTDDLAPARLGQVSGVVPTFSERRAPLRWCSDRVTRRLNQLSYIVPLPAAGQLCASNAKFACRSCGRNHASAGGAPNDEAAEQ